VKTLLLLDNNGDFGFFFPYHLAIIGTVLIPARIFILAE
jgi:hypothetical protein